MSHKTFRYSLTGIFIFAVAALQISSMTSFRLKLADHYKNNDQHERAVRVYGKILRKDSVKRDLSDTSFARINFEIGGLAAKLGFINLAIESYARAGRASALPDLAEYGGVKDLSRAKLPAIGLLEAGRFESAAKEFRRLAKLYPDFRDAGGYIEAAESLKRQNISGEGDDFYFALGDAYVKNGLFDEARALFTKRMLDYGVYPMDALRYLREKYSQDEAATSRIWGDDIYVVLEDFETAKTQFKRYMSNTRVKVNKHVIAEGAAYDGNYSELLDMTYPKWGYDYWVKEVKIALDDRDLKLALRFFVKGDNISGRQPLVWIVYKRQGSSAVSNTPHMRRKAGNGWEEWRIDGLSESARAIASKNGWSPNDMTMEKVIIDMQGCSGKFYIDGIQLVSRK